MSDKQTGVLEELEAGKDAAGKQAVDEQQRRIEKFKRQVVKNHFKAKNGKAFLDVNTLTDSEIAAIDDVVRGAKPSLKEGDSIDSVLICAEHCKVLGMERVASRGPSDREIKEQRAAKRKASSPKKADKDAGK